VYLADVQEGGRERERENKGMKHGYDFRRELETSLDTEMKNH